MKILVVDDQRVILSKIKEYLDNLPEHYEVFLWQESEEIEHIIAEKDIDIVLLDIVMPKRSGLKVLEGIRENKKYNDVQVIMLTSLEGEESFKACFDKGADDFLRKPVNPIALQARLKAAAKTRSNAKRIHKMFLQLKEQNKRLRNLNKALEDTQFHMIQKEKLAAIGELAAGIAHEINNPLGYVGSNIDTLQNFSVKIINVIKVYREKIKEIKSLYGNKVSIFVDAIKEEEERNKINFVLEEFDEALEDSKEGIERVSKIVQTLKNFARTGIENETTLNNINSIVSEALLIVKNEAKYSMDIKTDLNEIPDILCNRSQIGQVILNILVNAIQSVKEVHTSTRGQINISTALEGDRVFLEVADNGAGISDEILNKIFDPFFTTKDVGQGTGLGLSISHDIIVNKHKGEIVAGNNMQGGAYFRIFLPVNSE